MFEILGTQVHPTSYILATQQIMDWAKRAESQYVCAANVHMIMEAYDDPDFCRIINRSALVTPDGMPLVWAMRLMGFQNQERVYGPDLTLHVAQAAAKNSVPVGLYGGKPETVISLADNLQRSFPGLRIAYQFSPPFRPLLPIEDERVVAEIADSGAQILFVGLGCPQQEKWMAEHHGRVKAVMLGVGAAFDFHAGVIAQAPGWMQNAGLEWLFRLANEPRRLWRRYLYHNPRFLLLVTLQLLRRNINFRERP